MSEYKLSIIQIDNMKHCIGWQWGNEPKKRKNKRPLVNAYRNYFTTGKFGNASLDEIVELGLMKKSVFQKDSNGLVYSFLYQVTVKGLEYIKELFDVEIKIDEADLVEVTQ